LCDANTTPAAALLSHSARFGADVAALHVTASPALCFHRVTMIAN
jgi:hypothetical protein